MRTSALFADRVDVDRGSGDATANGSGEGDVFVPGWFRVWSGWVWRGWIWYGWIWYGWVWRGFVEFE